MLVIGLTGNIGSGKSTIADMFAKLGVPIIDSDQVARDIVKPGMPALATIAQHFGEDFLLASGELDRKKLRQHIFAHPEARLWLEDLLHPIIRKEMAKALVKLNAPYAILVIPLLVDRPPNPFIQRVLLADTSPELRTQRVCQRDQADAATVEAIIAAQASREQLLHAADDVIENNSDLENLQQQVNTLHKKYLTLALNL